MEMTSITLSLSRPPPPSLPLASSQSNFISSSNTISLFSRSKSQNKSVFVVGQPIRRTSAVPARRGLICNSLFGLGVPELVVIAGVVTLLFGPKKLPEVGKSIGKTVKSFQQAAKEFETEIRKSPDGDESTEPSEETPKAVIEEKKPDVEVSSSKESV